MHYSDTTKIYSFKHAIQLIETDPKPLEVALKLIEKEKEELNFSFSKFSNFKIIANLLKEIQHKKVFTYAFLDILSQKNELQDHKLQKQLLLYIEENFKFYPVIKKELLDFYDELVANYTKSSVNKNTFPKKENNLNIYIQKLKNKPCIDTQATPENDPVLADFYNKKKGILTSMQRGMGPDWTLTTAKN